MEEWFKYEYGFVNIDDQFLYFTNTGNWSEVKTLKEKTGKTKFKNDFKKIRIVGFLALCLLGLTSLFLMNLASPTVSIKMLIGIVAACYALYHYFQSEIGPSYKIPKEKIVNIFVEGKLATINFRNCNDELDSQELINIEEKGIKLLSKIFPVA